MRDKEMEKIKKFIKDEPIKFDFSNECTKDLEYVKKEGYEKYFAYKTQKNIGDPDSKSVLLQDIYKVLWPELFEKNYMNGEKWLKSDTMTSVHHTMAKYYDVKFPKEVERYMSENPRQRFISPQMCKNMFEQYESVKAQLIKNKDFEHFVSVYHTLGNYSPVPSLFNMARSGPGCTSSYDYWDLTLMKIKNIMILERQRMYS